MQAAPEDAAEKAVDFWDGVIAQAEKLGKEHIKTFVKKVNGKCPESYTQAEGEDHSQMCRPLNEKEQKQLKYLRAMYGKGGMFSFVGDLMPTEGSSSDWLLSLMKDHKGISKDEL